MINYETDIGLGREFTLNEIIEFCTKYKFPVSFIIHDIKREKIVLFYKNHSFLLEYCHDSKKYMIVREMIDWGDVD